MSVTAAQGFLAAGVAAGIKAGGAPDLALVTTVDGKPVPAAGVFTTNRAAAAPVQVSRAHLAHTNGHAAAVILNAGNANAATGEPGLHTAEGACALVADAIGAQPADVLVCSTGLIGIPLGLPPFRAGVPVAVAGLDSSDAAGAAAAEAIRTTDTYAKQACAISGGVTVGGMAKGAAMLSPNMATMLAVVTTDAKVAPSALREVLVHAMDESFHRITVDGCTSTNDSVIVLANGAASADGTDTDPELLRGLLSEVCFTLAAEMVNDAEGATKSVRVSVVGAHSDDDAARIARRIAESQLVKCSWYGQDPYWGRIVSEAGSAGAAFDISRVSVRYGDVRVCEGGVEVDHDAASVRAHMAQRHIDVEVDLGLGHGSHWLLTNDLTHAYVDENMGTS